jgi:hypothetical protein
LPAASGEAPAWLPVHGLIDGVQAVISPAESRQQLLKLLGRQAGESQELSATRFEV